MAKVRMFELSCCFGVLTAGMVFPVALPEAELK